MSETKPMSQAVKRARDYVAIFLNVGDDWHRYVPVDGKVVNGRVRLDGVEMWPDGDAWHISDGNGGQWGYRSATKSPTGDATVR